MLAVRAALDELTLAKDGVDGKSIYLYGEGWNFGEVANNARFAQATQGQLGGTGIGTFSDRLRDAVRGGGPFDEDPRKQGFGTGLSHRPERLPVTGRRAAAGLGCQHDTDLVQLGLAGNLRAFAFRGHEPARRQARRRGRLQRQPRPGYADQPDEVISYVDAHDNETLFDALTYKLPAATTMEDRVRMNTAVAGDHRAVAVAVVLARRRRPAAQQVAGPQQLRLAATGSTRLDWTGCRQRLRPRPAAQGATTRPSGRTRSRCWPTRR